MQKMFKAQKIIEEVAQSLTRVTIVRLVLAVYDIGDDQAFKA
jgi:hypothetical protein